MDLILWRHCEAEPGEPDLGRRLTSKGVKQAERMAAWLDAHLPDTCRILVVAGRPRAADGARAEAQVQDGAGTGARRVGGERARRGQLARFARARADRRAPAARSAPSRRSCCRARRRTGRCARARSGGCPNRAKEGGAAVVLKVGAGAGLRLIASRRVRPASGVSVRAPARARGSRGPPTLRARRRAGATSADARRASASRSRT